MLTSHNNNNNLAAWHGDQTNNGKVNLSKDNLSRGVHTSMGDSLKTCLDVGLFNCNIIKLFIRNGLFLCLTTKWFSGFLACHTPSFRIPEKNLKVSFLSIFMEIFFKNFINNIPCLVLNYIFSPCKTAIK